MPTLLLLLILLPAIAALVCYFVRSSAVRTLTVVATGIVLTLASLGLLSQGAFEPLAVGSLFGISSDFLISVLDFVLLGVIFFYGVKHKSVLIQAFTLAQIGLLVWFESVMLDHAAVPALMGDQLSLILVLVIRSEERRVGKEC